MMAELLGVPMDNKKPCVLSLDARLLSNQFRGQLVIKIAYLKFLSQSLNPLSTAATLLAGPTSRMV